MTKEELTNILSNKLTENILPNNDLNKRILELTKYMVEQGMNIKPLPKVKFVHNLILESTGQELHSSILKQL